MSKTILVTGPDLDPSATRVLTEHGYEAVHTPPYADSAVISDFMERTGAVGDRLADGPCRRQCHGPRAAASGDFQTRRWR